MRYRLMATYLGVPYHAGLGPDGADVTLFSPGPPPEELGFTAAAGHWRKQVGVSDLTALWQSRLVGDYRGEPCLVLDDLGERLHLVYLGRDAARARQLGYWEIDREVFEVVVPVEDVTGLTEERVEFPPSAAAFAPSGPVPSPSGADPLAGADPLSGVFPPVRGFPPIGGEPEPDTLIYSRPGPQGHSAPRADTDPPGPRTRMEPTGARAAATGPRGGQPTAAQPWGGQPTGPQPQHRADQHHGGQPAGYPGPERAPRTPDRMAAWHGSPASEPWPEPWPEPWTDSDNGAASTPPVGGLAPTGTGGAPPSGRRTARRDRVSPQAVFAELLDLAGIPDAAYAVDEEVPGAMCVVKAESGFEVFSCTEDARLEVHFFEAEEAAYFYLFGVLAAEAVRSGRMAPTRQNSNVNGTSGPAAGAPRGPGMENLSKYLRTVKLPKSLSRRAIVN